MTRASVVVEHGRRLGRGGLLGSVAHHVGAGVPRPQGRSASGAAHPIPLGVGPCSRSPGPAPSPNPCVPGTRKPSPSCSAPGPTWAGRRPGTWRRWPPARRADLRSAGRWTSSMPGGGWSPRRWPRCPTRARPPTWPSCSATRSPAWSEPYAIFGPARWSGATTTGCTWSARSGRPSSPIRAGSRHRPARPLPPAPDRPGRGRVQRGGPGRPGAAAVVADRRGSQGRPGGLRRRGPVPGGGTARPGAAATPRLRHGAHPPRGVLAAARSAVHRRNPCPANPRRSPGAGGTPP